MNAGRLRAWHFAWRGWILAGLLLCVAYARWRSQAPLQPGWLLLLALGSGWRAWAGSHIESHSNGSAWSGVAAPAAAGPYGISRHPLYFANLLCAAGLVLFAHCLPPWAACLALALAAAHHEALARSEEAYLLESAGEAYRGYMRVTPRWPGLPRAARVAPLSVPHCAPLSATDSTPHSAEARVRASGRGGWREALARQGWNLAKGGAGAALLWIAAALR